MIKKLGNVKLLYDFLRLSRQKEMKKRILNVTTGN